MPLWACLFGATCFASVVPITVVGWIGIRRGRQRQATIDSEIGAAKIPEWAGGYNRGAVRSYLEVSRDLREKGFAAAPPGVFPRNRRLRGYDPQADDRHVADLAREAAVAGLRLLPALPVETEVPHSTGPQVSRAERRQYKSDCRLRHG